MPRKHLKCRTEFSSIVNDPKWMVEIRITGFSSKKPKANILLLKDVYKAIDQYNRRRT